MGPLVAVAGLLVSTAFLGVVALTSTPGSRACWVATWLLTASTMVVAGTAVATLLGVAVPASTAALLAGCPLLVLGVASMQARRLQRRIDQAQASMRETRGVRHPA